MKRAVSIYKPCDIRGDAACELTPKLYRQWGYALGRQIGPGDKFVVGGDTRESTPGFLAALMDGLCAAGVDCIDLGQLPTPMIYHAQRRLRARGYAVVTASHSPASVNGLQWMVDGLPPRPEELAEQVGEIGPGESCGDRARSTARDLDISFDYVSLLQDRWIDALRAQQHIVVEPMHGCWVDRARRYLHAVFPECLISVTHDTRRAEFDGQRPDCAEPDNLGELCEAVYRERAHLGVAFDGDGDRLALVDNEGIPLTAEEATWVLLQSFSAEFPGKHFVYDLKFSDRVPEAARQLGAEPLCERSGRAFLRGRMRDSGAVFGAEISGHYFFGDLDGGDDGMFAACRVIACLAQTGQSLADVRRACPQVFMTPDLRVPMEPALQDQVLAQVRDAWAQFPQTSVDGVRIELPVGWALVRSSVTESALCFRFEATDWGELHELVGRFCNSLPQVGDQVWRQYQVTLGAVER